MTDIAPDEESSETIHRIPPRHRNCHLFNYDWSRIAVGEKGKGVIDKFLKEWRNGEAPHLILSGKPGRGKTHLAVGIYRFGVYHTDLTRSVYIHVPAFCHSVKQSFSDNEIEDPFLDVTKASLLVLDDIFGRKLSAWELEQVIPRLLSIAYDNKAALVVTTNHDRDGILARLDPHEASRLFDNSRTLMFVGEDQRLR